MELVSAVAAAVDTSNKQRKYHGSQCSKFIEMIMDCYEKQVSIEK